MAAVPSIGRATSVEPRRAAPEADATRDLYERYGRQIFNYCVHQLGSREEAEDATQTTFMNAFRGLQRGVVPELESAWLFKIANNVILTRRRSSSRRRRVESPGDLDAIQDLLPSRERNADELIRLSEALAAMPDQQRRALLLREWQGLSYHEIADELSLSQSAVETLLFRARRTLAAGLTEPPETRKRGRLRSGVDIGSLVAAVKTLLTGGAAVKTVATVAAVATTAVVAAAPTPAPKRHHPRPEPAPPAATTTAPTVGASAAPAAAPVALAPAATKPRAAKHVRRRRPPAGSVASHVRAGTSLAPEQAPAQAPVAAAPAPAATSAAAATPVAPAPVPVPAAAPAPQPAPAARQSDPGRLSSAPTPTTAAAPPMQPEVDSQSPAAPPPSDAGRSLASSSGNEYGGGNGRPDGTPSDGTPPGGTPPLAPSASPAAVAPVAAPPSVATPDVTTTVAAPLLPSPPPAAAGPGRSGDGPGRQDGGGNGNGRGHAK